MAERQPGEWHQIQTVPPIRYVCGHCSTTVSSQLGWLARIPGSGSVNANIRVCPECNQPTYIWNKPIPGVSFGGPVAHLPKGVESLYDEARSCTSASAYTPAVLATRKLLMHIAVERGAKEGESFQSYVQYLADKGFVPPDGKGWVDHIRNKGNEANHEIRLMTKEDAEELLIFTEMLLKFVYEFPSRVPKPLKPASS